MMKVANDRSPARRRRAAAALLPGLDQARPGAGRLLEAAVLAFAERGYHGVSVRDLTTAIGIQGASFYSHFESKEELLFRIVLLVHERYAAALREALLGAGAEPAAQLRATIRAHVSMQAAHPYAAIVASTELHALSPAHRERILQMRQESVAMLSAIIERGNALGVFHCAKPWLAVSAIGAMGMRLAWWFRTPDQAGERGSLRAYAEAAKWFPGPPVTLEEVVDEYTEYAMRIVG
ncbi:MAG: TetR/AcrR family transcriptional regulator [Candidatus Binatia bacterium]